MHSVKYGASAVKHAQRALDFSREIYVARCIDNVDADVAPKTRGRGRGNRNAALLLLLHPVHRRGDFMDISDAVRSSRLEKKALRPSRVHGIDLGHGRD